MHAFVSKIFETISRKILGLTLYDMMLSSHDFEDVKAALNDRTHWSIELFRSCFTIHLSDGGYFFMLSTLFFLVLAENMHVHYGRLSPAELKERAQQVGYATLAILFALLDLGFVIVRVAGLVSLSGSPTLAANLVVVSMSPAIVLPLLTYLARLLKERKREPTSDVEVESGIVVNGAQN